MVGQFEIGTLLAGICTKWILNGGLIALTDAVDRSMAKLDMEWWGCLNLWFTSVIHFPILKGTVHFVCINRHISKNRHRTPTLLLRVVAFFGLISSLDVGALENVVIELPSVEKRYQKNTIL